jgi:tetratricopeptide (TPR) repeat protein
VAWKGAGSGEAEASYLHAHELVERLGNGPRLFPVLWGLWFANYNRRRYAAARELGQRLLETAQTGDDTVQLLEAHHALWPTLTAMGQPAAAIIHAERGVALYDRERHASQAFLYGGHDPGACCRYMLAINRWLLGYPDRSLGALHEAVRLADGLKHPLTMVITFWHAAWVYYHRGERNAAVAAADRLLALATEYGLSTWTDVAIALVHAKPDARLDAAILADVHRQLVATWSGAAVWLQTFCLCALAELAAEVGQLEDAFKAFALIPAAARDALYAPEIRRIEGELLLRGSAPAMDEAERCFREAIDVARSHREVAGASRPRPAWPGSGSVRASATTRGGCSVTSTGGSPKALTPPTSAPPAASWRKSPERQHGAVDRHEVARSSSRPNGTRSN